MKLKIKNIGKIYNETEIEINGITVLAGENGTGKSTVGKILYCVYNTLSNYDEQLIYERERSISRILRQFGRYNIRRFQFYGNELIRGLIDKGYDNDEDLVTEISNITSRKPEEISEEIIQRVKEVLATTDDEIADAMLKRRIKAEFDMQVGHVNYPNIPSSIELQIKNEYIKIYIENDKVKFHEKIKLTKDIVYVDDPYVVDDMDRYYMGDDCSHRLNLIKKLKYENDGEVSAVDDVIVGKKLDEIYNKLNSICIGSVLEDEDEELYYSEKSLKKRISTVNLSTGVKSFVILKTLLQTGFLEQNGIVVLDEPETHLHPEWMLIYAEIIVLLHNILGINVIISTHNSEFLSFIQLFSKKHNCSSVCKYYMLHNDNEDVSKSVLEDYTENVDAIYEKMTRPFLAASKALDNLN